MLMTNSYLDYVGSIFRGTIDSARDADVAEDQGRFQISNAKLFL